MAVWYLDNDDEITDAVARLRSATDERVIFVVPPGSRIATGRINFRLLAREAGARDLALAIASPDEQVRALATSAGVIARHTVDEAESSLARGDAPPLAATPDPAGSTAGSTSQAGGETAAAAGASTAPAATGTRVARGRGRLIAGAGVAVVALAIVGGVASLQYLPTASITLRPATSLIGPLDLQVTASTSADVVDVDAREVPAAAITFPLAVQETFEATGAATVATRAAGEVVFSSTEQTFDQEIVAGTRLRSTGGVEFETTETVVLERPEDGSAASVTAPVEAVSAGPEGNLPAGRISIVPSLESQGIDVTNPRPTSGGRMEQTPIVTRSDVEAASVDLRNRLAGALASRLRQEDVAPEGMTVYPESAQLGDISLEPAGDELVGASTPQFELRAEAEAEVLAVAVDDVERLMVEALQAAVPADMTLLPDSVAVRIAEGDAGDDQVAFEGAAEGVARITVDPADLTARVAGMPVSEARAILAGYGTASVEIWPEFLNDMPGDPERISLDLLEPTG